MRATEKLPTVKPSPDLIFDEAARRVKVLGGFFVAKLGGGRCGHCPPFVADTVRAKCRAVQFPADLGGAEKRKSVVYSVVHSEFFSAD